MTSENGFRLERTAMLVKHRRPQVVGICWSEANRLGPTILDQRGDESVEMLCLAQDAAKVPFDDRIVGDTIAKQSRRRRDGVHGTSQLVRERGCHVLSDLHALRMHAGYYLSAARRKALSSSETKNGNEACMPTPRCRFRDGGIADGVTNSTPLFRGLLAGFLSALFGGLLGRSFLCRLPPTGGRLGGRLLFGGFLGRFLGGLRGFGGLLCRSLLCRWL